MKKSLSLLVAIAMVFSMFSAVAAAASESGTKLQGLGVIKGNQNGDLLEDANWLRQDVAVLMSRLAGKETEAKETVKSHTFTDVRGTFYDGYISWAKENNFMQGNSATNFGFDNEITYKEFATVILRALGVDTSDYSKIGELAIAAGIIDDKLNLDEKAVRGVTYDIITTALDKEVDGQKLGTKLGLPGYEVVAPAIAVAPTAVKEVTVTFNKEIATDKAKFELKRGNATVTVDKVTYSEDKKVAKLELNSKLIAGDYTVVAKDATEAELTASFSAENEKVANIEFVGDKFALGTNDDANGSVNSNEIEISYKVTNQYGEDVSKTFGGSVNFQPSKGEVKSKTNGVLVVKNSLTGVTFTIGEKVFVNANYSNGTNNVFVSNTFEVGAQARVNEVTVKELYHPEGKKISAGSTFSEYTILFEAHDQYGNNITNLTKLANELNVYVTNQTIFDIATSSASKANFVDGQGKDKNQLGLKLKAPNTNGYIMEGTNSIVFNSTFTGKQTKFDVEVTKGSAVETITLTSPSSVAIGDKKVTVPYQAVDGNGNEVTKYDDLVNRITLNSSFPTAADGKDALRFVKDSTTGKATIELHLTNVNAKGTYSMSAYVKNSPAQSTVQVTVNERPAPSYIKKVDFDRNKILKNDGTASFEVKLDKIVIEDTLSRNWKLEDNTGAYEAKLTHVSGTNFAIADATLPTTIEANASGTGRYKVTLWKKAVDGEAAKEVSSYEFTVSTAAVSELKDFSVNDISKFFGGVASGVPAHKREVKVFGKRTSDGEQFQLDPAQYSVEVPTTKNLKYDGKNIIVDADTTGYPFGKSDPVEESFSFTVTVPNGKGGIETFNKTATVSNVLPKVTKVEYRTEKKFKGESGYVTVQTGANFATVQDVFNGLKFIDQYGDDATYDPSVTISGIDNVGTKFTGGNVANGVVTGTASAITPHVVSGDKFIVSYTIKGEFSNTITVEVE
ncbi:S-layer homology domain-containing protein [Paenibacillus sp. SYP-B4298]|uniref:S-layer homology domain-containing protein n=1 Tax=Paenibacillus sp. SYP-B4298 TaxID=2996034 RepID=UPI0022DE4956|nr:S-layer homology domain-containing protein [Paenibacillus sp. SYP-B4298]